MTEKILVYIRYTGDEPVEVVGLGVFRPDEAKFVRLSTWKEIKGDLPMFKEEKEPAPTVDTPKSETHAPKQKKVEE